jgi:hypothetical protein
LPTRAPMRCRASVHGTCPSQRRRFAEC